MVTVQRLFRYLERQGVIVQDPTLNLVLPSWNKLTRAVLNQAHARRLIANPDILTPRGKRDRALLELLYGTAIRVGECERLDLNYLDLARAQLMIRSGKGRKDRVALCANIRETPALAAIAEEGGRMTRVEEPEIRAVASSVLGCGRTFLRLSCCRRIAVNLPAILGTDLSAQASPNRAPFLIVGFLDPLFPGAVASSLRDPTSDCANDASLIGGPG